MKRNRHQQSLPETGTDNGTDGLGALELAAALNGDDPRLVLDCLKRFVRIVRQERRLALSKTTSKGHIENNGSDDDDDDDQSSSDDEEHSKPSSQTTPQKRFKASESWKEDTKSYHVPFVGTSVAKGGRDRGVVVKGEWPTGLLKAYLDRSSLAVELTGDSLIPPSGHIHKSLLRNKQGKLSQTIYKTYLKALAELVTAAIPKERLQQEATPNEKMQSEQPRYLGVVMKERLPGLLTLLQSETKRGKGPSGPLVPFVLHILSNIALTSVPNARQLTRDLQQFLSEGVFKAIIRLPPLHQHDHKKDEVDRKHDTIRDDGQSIKDPRREEGRTALLQLARALLSIQDSTVLHYGTSPGSKDRKLSSGIFVLALRDGPRDTFHRDSSLPTPPTQKAYYREMVCFLRTLRQVVWGSSNEISTRRWTGLFTVDVLQNLCDISLMAPPLAKPELFSTVLDATDTHDNKSTSPLDQPGIEARRFLWPLLVDPLKSPLLQAMQQVHKNNSHNSSGRDHNQQNNIEQAIIRAMVRLLDTHPPSGRLALHRCLCFGMQTTPILLPTLFQKLTVPDPTKHPFSFLARLRLLSQLLGRDGPSPSKCIPNNMIATLIMEEKTDHVIRIILPLGFKKNICSKAIQSKNALIVCETLKFLVCIFQRWEMAKKEIDESAGGADCRSFWVSLSTKMMALFPDVQVLLSIISRFDLQQQEDRAAPLVHSHLSQVLMAYANHLPEVMCEAKFDWIKLLPNSEDDFCRLPLVLQVRVLRTLETILKINKMSSVSPSSCQLLLGIMTKTSKPIVHSTARDICRYILGQVNPASGLQNEISQCLDYEMSCWVDCIRPDVVPEFCSVLEAASQLSVQSDILLLRAWKAVGLKSRVAPKLSASPLLLAAMSHLTDSASCSNEMASLVYHVTCKCLLYHHNPLPLAVLVRYYYEMNPDHSEEEIPQDETQNVAKKAILEYADSLIAFESVSEDRRAELQQTMVVSCFSKKSFHFEVLQTLKESLEGQKLRALLRNTLREDVIAAIRQVSHVLACSNSESMRRNCFAVFRILAPVAIEDHESSTSDVVLGNILSRMGCCEPAELRHIDFLVLSQIRKTIPASTLRRLMAAVDDFTGNTTESLEAKAVLFNESTREKFISLLFLKPFLPFNLLNRIVEAMKGVLSNHSDGPECQFLVAAATSYVQEMLSHPEASQVGCTISINLFQTWLAVTDSTRHGAPQNGAGILWACLEKLLCYHLAKQSAASEQLYLASLQQDTHTLINRVIAKRAQSTSVLDEKTCLLARLVYCDPWRFAPVLLGALFRNKTSKAISDVWLKGAFDSALLVALRRSNVMEGLQEDAKAFADALLRRSKMILGQIRATKQELSDDDKVFEMLELVDRKLLGNRDELVPLANEIVLCLKSSNFQDAHGRMRCTSRTAFLQTAVNVRIALHEGDADQKMIRQALSTVLFVRLCEYLAYSLRKTVKKLEKGGSVVEIVDPVLLIGWLRPLVCEFPGFEMEILNALDPKCVASALRGCLRYGLDSKGLGITAANCLSLAREIVLATSITTSSGVELQRSPSASEVFEMIVTHSKFNETLLKPCDDEVNAATKLELVRLLLACVSISKETIVFEGSVWDALLTAYGAGVGVTDSTLRRLLYVAAKRQADCPSLPFMDDFRWSGVTKNDSNAKSQDVWDWLIDGLHLGRVHQSLRLFPINDSIPPAPLPEIEEWAQLNSVTNGDNELGDRPNSGDHVEKDFLHETEKRAATHESYSPAYILPLILAALESSVKGTTDEISHNTSTEPSGSGLNPGTRSGGGLPPDGKPQLLARTAQRLCDRGALSLALASLCSRCPSVRQIAVAVLCLLMRAVDSKEAREVASWRERPQLAMLLHSVHRSLAMRRATLLSDKPSSENPSTESAAWDVPLLPGFSAIFLARAALVLARPGDNMYAPLNRFFLSIDHDHGAFRDMNRLPAFITFLCSSADEPAGQARNERSWALKLFRDGFLNEFCFKMASTCHAPELLLTTIYNHRMRPLHGSDGSKPHDDECVLLLEAVERMVRQGGRHAAYHLIARMGLLSWLRCVLESSIVDQIIPTMAARVAFLRLLESSVYLATQYEAHFRDTLEDPNSANDDSCFLMEISSLARPTLHLCTASFKDGIEHRFGNAQSELMPDMANASLRALQSLQSALQSQASLRDNNTVDDVRADGIDLTSALVYLSKATSSSISSPSCPQPKDVIAVLTGLPISLTTTNMQDVVVFCSQCLDVIMGAAQRQDEDTSMTRLQSLSLLSKQWIIQVLQRLSLLLQHHICKKTETATSRNVDDDGHKTSISSTIGGTEEQELMLLMLLRKLLTCRTICFQWKESRDIWLVCLDYWVMLQQGQAARDGVEPMKIDNGVSSDNKISSVQSLDLILQMDFGHHQ